jgi:hypothetical protein
MNDFIMTLVKVAIAVLPLLFLCFRLNKTNLPKEQRNRQFFMPIIALLFSIVVMLFINPINEGLMSIINNIPIWISNLANLEWMPDFISSALSGLSDWINNIIKSLNLQFWVFFISNYVIFVAYVIMKKIVLKIASAILNKKTVLVNKISEYFYTYNSERNLWCLRTEYSDARTFLKYLFVASCIIFSLIMVASRWMYFNGLIKSVFYPIFAIFMIGEIFFYLDSMTFDEYERSISGEDDLSIKIVNYSLLRKYLRNLFGDKLLSESTNVNISLSDNISNEEVLDRLLNDEDSKVASLGIFYCNLNKSGFDLDHNYLNSSLDLLKGESVLFNNPFYKDLIPYAFYPMNRALLQHKKVLVILGRHSIENDIKDWIQEGIESITNIPFLWRTDILTESNNDLDIGIMTRSNVINTNVHKHNKKFLEEVGFVVLLEPSKLITTAQIGLSLIIKQCRNDEDKKIVFCLCDKNCDGLVDTMSHILQTSLTEVSATNKHKGTCSYMCWESDSDLIHHRQLPNISRYLGMGTELSFAALKNQVSEVMWLGGEAFPVTDIKWVMRHYYYDLMKYAALPTSQEAMNEYFKTSHNFWSAEVRKNNYFTVEDESCNMFEISRNFSTRSTEQGFINVISSSYMLKDYMADNNSIFETDAKAIPYIVADFARTRRNVILKLLLLMSEDSIDEKTVRKELSLLGLPVGDIKKQLWYEIYRALSSVETVYELQGDYVNVIDAVYKLELDLKSESGVYNSSVLISEERFNFERSVIETVYYISDLGFIKQVVDNLKSASYVSEDEKGEKYYLGAEHKDHIYQKMLPGQFFTYDGKYYEMLYLTSDGQVLVRRASDHINGRQTYRQIRNYKVSAVRASESIGSSRNIGGIKISSMNADFSVATNGYFVMEKHHDFSSAKKVCFEGEKSKIPDRRYNNKGILRIDFPNMEELFSDRIRLTITLLMNEVFRTLFAENAPYIVALTDVNDVTEDEVNPLTYSLELPYENNGNSIYIIEDSYLDMGLLIAVERNLKRILQIIEDYLSWNKRAIALSLRPPKEDEPVKMDPSQVDFEEGKGKPDNIIKRFFKVLAKPFKKIGEIFKKLFRRKPKKNSQDVEPETKPVTEEESQNKYPPEDNTFPTEGVQDNGDFVIDDSNVSDDKLKIKTADNSETDDGFDKEPPIENIGSDSPSQTANMARKELPQNVESNGQKEKSPLNFSRLPYHQRYYLLYGGDSEPEVIDSNGTLSYLKLLGLGNNPLKEARRGKRISKYVETTFQPNKKNARYCDFCGNEIYGVEYETLADGRDRCISCGRTAIKTETEFIKIFEDVKRNLESFFGIKINAGIRVQMVNATKLHKSLGKTFVPTSDYDGRVLGVAINKGGNFTLMIENGSPRMMSMLTMAHELTHIWQYINWNQKAILKKYGKVLNLQIYEGMAKWVEIQYAYLINEPATAKREEIITANRSDEYGFGYIRYKANYPISTGTVITHDTPFMNIETPLDPMYCGSDISILLAEDNSKRYDEDLDDDNYEEFFEDDDFDEEDITPAEEKTVIARNPENVPLYAYNQLNASEKVLYDKCYEALVSFKDSLEELDEGITEQSLEKIRDYILIDHPELFWFAGRYVYYTDSTTGKVTKVEFKYSITESEAEKRKNEIESAISPFEKGIEDSMSDYEVAKTIYKNIIELVDYDSIALEKSEKASDDLTSVDLRSIYGVFVNRKAVCAGYAKATQYLMNKYGIECIQVTGTTERDALHAWNLIKLEGDYYYIDTTWDDHSNTDSGKNTSLDVTYNYFCVTTDELLIDHTPDATITLPECNSTKCNYFYRTGNIVNAYSFEKVRTIVKRNVLNGIYTISLKCIEKADYQNLIKEMIDGKKFFEIIQYLNLSNQGRVNSSYSFIKEDKKHIITFVLKKN